MNNEIENVTQLYQDALLVIALEIANNIAAINCPEDYSLWPAVHTAENNVKAVYKKIAELDLALPDAYHEQRRLHDELMGVRKFVKLSLEAFVLDQRAWLNHFITVFQKNDGTRFRVLDEQEFAEVEGEVEVLYHRLHSARLDSNMEAKEVMAIASEYKSIVLRLTSKEEKCQKP
jgi:uncharacterized membrane protein